MYTYSFYTKVNTARLVRRPWWNPLGRDVLVWEDKWVRRVYTLSGEAGKFVQAAHNDRTPQSRAVLELILLLSGGEGTKDFQLEEGPQPTSYIHTSPP